MPIYTSPTNPRRSDERHVRQQQAVAGPVDSEETFLAEVVARIETFIAGLGARDDFSCVLGEVVEHILMAESAKLARPRMVYRFGRLLNIPAADLVDLGMATEFLHVASLLHDDVIDKAERRRGRISANRRWSNVIAVLGGDALLCESLARIGGYTPEMARRAVRVIDEMTRGIVMEIEARGRIDLNLSDWRKIAAAKTAVLFGWCGWAPAHWADQPELGAQLERCGYHLGIAFQMADDLLDFSPEDQGKPRFADIRARFPSYPIIAASNYSPETAQALLELWRQDVLVDDEVARIGQLICDSGAMEQTFRDIKAESAAALDALGEFAQEEGGREIATWIELIPLKARQTLNQLRQE